MKSFSKNLSFRADFKLQVPPLMYKINTLQQTSFSLNISIQILFGYLPTYLPIYKYIHICKQVTQSNCLLSKWQQSKTKTSMMYKKTYYRITKSPWSSRQGVVEFHDRHQNKIQKVFLWRFPLSFLAITLRVNKITMKSFFRSESTLNCRSRHLCIKLTHTT